MKKSQAQERRNDVDHTAKMAGCDAVFVECRSETAMPAVSPYNTKTGEWILGLTLLTSWDEIFAAEVKKVCSDNPADIANKKLQEFYSLLAPKKTKKLRK